MYYKINYKPTPQELQRLKDHAAKMNEGIKDKSDHIVVEDDALDYIAGYPRQLCESLEKSIKAEALPERAESVEIFASKSAMVGNGQASATMESDKGEPGVNMQSLAHDLRAVLDDLDVVAGRLDELPLQVSGTAKGFKGMYIGVVVEDDAGELQHFTTSNVTHDITESEAVYLRSIMEGHCVEQDKAIDEQQQKLKDIKDAKVSE